MKIHRILGACAKRRARIGTIYRETDKEALLDYAPKCSVANGSVNTPIKVSLIGNSRSGVDARYQLG